MIALLTERAFFITSWIRSSQLSKLFSKLCALPLDKATPVADQNLVHDGARRIIVKITETPHPDQGQLIFNQGLRIPTTAPRD